MIDPEYALSISRQAEELEISRSTVYYQPRPVSDADLFLMRRIDELHMNYPFAGSRMLRDMLSLQGLEVGPVWPLAELVPQPPMGPHSSSVSAQHFALTMQIELARAA